VPKHTVLGKLMAGSGDGRQEVVPVFAWTNNECKGISEFYEEAILVPSLSQGVALIWAEEMNERDRPTVTTRSEDDELLPELDGQMQFGKRIRRR